MTSTLAPAPPLPGRDEARRSAAQRRWTGMVLCLVALAVLGLLSVTFGARDISIEDLLAALGGADENVSQAAVRKRIPRTALAMLVGAALGLAGAVMQGITRNPLADPGILGVTSGASLAVVTGIAFFGLRSATGFVG